MGRVKNLFSRRLPFVYTHGLYTCAVLVFLLFTNSVFCEIKQVNEEGNTSLKKSCEIALKTIAWSGKAAAIVIKSQIYPIYGPIVLGYEFYHSKEKNNPALIPELTEKHFIKEWRSIALWAFMMGLKSATSTSLTQFYEKTSAFDEDNGEEVLTIVVVLPNGNLAYEKMYASKKKKKNFHVIFATNLDNALDQADALSKQTHLPVKLDIYGEITDAPDPATPLHSGRSLTVQTIKDGVNPEKSNLAGIKVRNNLFGKVGKLRIVSDSVGYGSMGDIYARSLGNALLRNGGTVYTSKVPFSLSLAEMFSTKSQTPPLPTFVKNFSENLVPITSLISAYQSKGVFLLSPNVRNTEVIPPSNLKNIFEETWSKRFDNLENNSSYEIYAADEIEHYLNFKKDTPQNVRSGYDQRWYSKVNDATGIRYQVHYHFENQKMRDAFVNSIQKDKEILEGPIFIKGSNETVIYRTQSKMSEKIEERGLQRTINEGVETKKELKSLYDSQLAKIDAEEKAKLYVKDVAKLKRQNLEKTYQYYKKLLPTYAFPWWMNQNGTLPNPTRYRLMKPLQE